MHPAHQALREWLQARPSAQIGEVWIRTGALFELRHVSDHGAPAESLREFLDPLAARELASATDTGKYRPLKSAPNLKRGWLIARLKFGGLIAALDCFYPGAVAMWHAWKIGAAQATSYRACAGRQSGMYRVTALLTDDQVRRVAGCGCRDGECLKSPEWSVDETTLLDVGRSERQENELAMPCLEPCSMLLAFARNVARLEQEERMKVEFTKSDLELIRSVLQNALEGRRAEYREGDYGDPRHRQRIQYFLKKYEDVLPKSRVEERESDE